MKQLELFDENKFITPMYQGLWMYKRTIDNEEVSKVLSRIPHSYGGECTVYTDSPGRFDMWFTLVNDIIKYRKGLLILNSLSEIGRSREAVLYQCQWIMSQNIEVYVSDMPSLQILERPKDNRFAFSIVLETLSSIKDWPRISDEQKSFSRMKYPDKWDELYAKWKKREIPTKELEKISNVSHNTFYKMLNLYKNGASGDVKTWTLR